MKHPAPAPRRQAASRNGRRRASGARSQRRAQSPRRYFHGPSFSGGLLIGAILVLFGSYLPEILQNRATLTQPPPADPERPAVQFEFEELLQSSEVAANTAAYADAQPDPEAAASSEYLLQAASFRSQDEADTLRAQLLLVNLPAAAERVQLANGDWYRVTVGPFQSRTQAERALTALRERDIAPLWIKRSTPDT